MAFVSAQNGGAITWVSSGDLNVTSSAFVMNVATEEVCPSCIPLISIYTPSFAAHFMFVPSLPPPTSCPTLDLSITTSPFSTASPPKPYLQAHAVSCSPSLFNPLQSHSSRFVCSPSISPLPESLPRHPITPPPLRSVRTFHADAHTAIRLLSLRHALGRGSVRTREGKRDIPVSTLTPTSTLT